MDKWYSKYNNSWEKYKRYSNWNYKKNNNTKYSAGILPYTYDLNGNCLVLLGKDQDGFWSDFGGRCEPNDNYDQKYTASREFYEESLGSILSISECIDKINANENKIISKTLNGSPYYMFVIYIDYYNYIESFIKTSNFMKYHYLHENYQLHKILEKSTMKWFSIEMLFSMTKNNNIINQNNNNYPLRNVFLKTLEHSKEQLSYIIK